MCSCKPGYSGADCSAVALVVVQQGTGHLVEDPSSEAAALSAPPRAAGVAGTAGALRAAGAVGVAGGASAQQAGVAAQMRVPSVPWDDGAHNGIPQGFRRPAPPQHGQPH